MSSQFKSPKNFLLIKSANEANHSRRLVKKNIYEINYVRNYTQMNFHFDLGVCVHTSADLRPTVHMFEKVVSYITAGAVEYTALHANVRAMSHAPLAVPAHSLSPFTFPSEQSRRCSLAVLTTSCAV